MESRTAAGRLSTATASLASTPCERVTPIADCINSSENGLVATFGSNNPKGFGVVIPVGLLNNMSPAPANRGQPTVSKLVATPQASRPSLHERLPGILMEPWHRSTSQLPCVREAVSTSRLAPLKTSSPRRLWIWQL